MHNQTIVKNEDMPQNLNLNNFKVAIATLCVHLLDNYGILKFRALRFCRADCIAHPPLIEI